MAKILMIDDDQWVRRLLNVFLRDKGYDVLLAENGQRGLELFRQDHPDVIVLDVNMRETDGIGILHHVRILNQDQRVIMFTGACDPAKEQEIHALGITEIVDKGSSLHSLEAALKRAFESREALAGYRQATTGE